MRHGFEKDNKTARLHARGTCQANDKERWHTRHLHTRHVSNPKWQPHIITTSRNSQHSGHICFGTSRRRYGERCCLSPLRKASKHYYFLGISLFFQRNIANFFQYGFTPVWQPVVCQMDMIFLYHILPSMIKFLKWCYPHEPHHSPK